MFAEMAPDVHIQSMDFGEYDISLSDNNDVKVSLSNGMSSPLILSAVDPQLNFTRQGLRYKFGTETIDFDPSISIR